MKIDATAGIVKKGSVVGRQGGEPVARMPGILEVAMPVASGRSLKTPNTPRIDISRASSSSQQEDSNSRESTPEKELLAGMFVSPHPNAYLHIYTLLRHAERELMEESYARLGSFKIMRLWGFVRVRVFIYTLIATSP